MVFFFKRSDDHCELNFGNPTTSECYSPGLGSPEGLGGNSIPSPSPEGILGRKGSLLPESASTLDWMQFAGLGVK